MLIEISHKEKSATNRTCLEENCSRTYLLSVTVISVIVITPKGRLEHVDEDGRGNAQSQENVPGEVIGRVVCDAGVI